MTADLITRKRIQHEIQTNSETVRRLIRSESLLSELESIVEISVNALKNGKKLLFAGNGGSAAQAQHLATEFVVRFNENRPALAAMALTVDGSALTACSNDFSYERVFSRQIEALGRPGDVFFAISTSGNSPSILLALQTARQLGLISVGFGGGSGGKMAPLCDHLLSVPSTHQARVQEAQMLLGHIFCGLVQEGCFPELFIRRP
jgi:D-sedoheptulose 7-phosphate isomerase